MTFSSQPYQHQLCSMDLVAAGICRGESWEMIYANKMLSAKLNFFDDETMSGSLMTRLTHCGFAEIEAIRHEPNGGEFIAHHTLGSLYVLRWKEIDDIADASGKSRVRLVTMTEVPIERATQVAELPWQELNVLLDSIHDGIWVIDSNGLTLRVNKAMERIADLKAADVIGKHVTEPMHKGRFETCVTLRALIEKRPVTMFDDYANGKRCLNTSTPIFDENGNVWRVIASIRDITELESLQRKLSELEMETLSYKARLHSLESEMGADFVGNSLPMRRLRKEVSKAARTEAITLILGETGTGKTLTARSIHDLSHRAEQAFVAINCGAIPMTLVESELFGYDKGAFTGASRGGKQGMFELAHKGTLLLDEIGELPLPMQAKLLQVLDGHPFHRVGGTKPIAVDVRVIAATNKPLAAMVASGQFREDLFYRLRVLTLEIPPLRERLDDIPILVMHFLREESEKNGLTKRFDPLVLNCFLTYPWPGNVRELRAIVQSLATMSEEETIMMQDLPPYMRTSYLPEQPCTPSRLPLREAVAELERNMIMAALTETGSTYKAARRLKVSQSTIVRKAQKYNLGHIEITENVE